MLYNINYFRNIKYSTIDKTYTGRMDCDYKILYNNRIIYIEIAGLLDQYKTWFLSNKSITNSKSKEEYRIKLVQKEKMLADNNTEYFILFPCDLTREFLFDILNGDYIKTKNKLKKFYKNNIDWTEIFKIGNLKYNKQNKGKDNQPEVCYESEAV